ncbi:MAG TPA: pyrroline-5-carboxylate reductase [Turneriella sp.]|nr:pyrroline-5-carboxylate reductase [Turneriella sp.]
MTIGIIGLGKMGSAIAQALAGKFEVVAYEKNENAIKNLRPSLVKKIRIVESLDILFSAAGPVIIAVKPTQVKEVVSAIRDHRLVISIAAGVTLQSIDEARKENGPTVRAMPNTPLVIKRGITAFTGNQFCTSADIETTKSFFESVGESLYLENEKLLHAVTGLSGSGPAYVYLFLQTLEDSGVLLGLSRDDSRRLAMHTVLGSAELARQSQSAPQNLIHDVTSPGGTTAVALKSLHARGFPNAVMEAVAIAARRSKELAGEK